jgi:hypothetical protein
MRRKPLPKTLQRWIAAHPGKVDEGSTEWDESERDWSHWIYLARGWRNAVLDPLAALHIVHEATVAEALVQLRGLAPCDCEECSRRED